MIIASSRPYPKVYPIVTEKIQNQLDETNPVVGFIERVNWDMFVEITGIKYDSDLKLHSAIQRGVRNLTNPRFKCGYFGLYERTPFGHARLLFVSAANPLYELELQESLRRSFKIDGFTPSIKVKLIEEVHSSAEYIHQIYTRYYGKTAGIMFGNKKAIYRSLLTKGENTSENPLLPF